VIPELTTERLRLRGIRPEDLDAYAAMYGDPDVMRFLEDGRTLDRAAAWRTMAMHLGHWELRGYGQWALVELATGEVIGRAGLWQPDGWPGLEVGWLLARSRWGHGFATEAGRASLGHAFDVLGAGNVISLIRPGNEPSVAVAARLGESYERTIDVLGSEVDVYGVANPGPSACR
jgi:RimJ/RimL family protein N-acetyltransferase